MMTPKLAGKAARLNQAGYSWEGIAERYGETPELIRQAIAQRARKRKILQLVRNERFQIRRLARLGERPAAIAAAFGMARSTVESIIKGEK